MKIFLLLSLFTITSIACAEEYQYGESKAKASKINRLADEVVSFINPQLYFQEKYVWIISSFSFQMEDCKKLVLGFCKKLGFDELVSCKGGTNLFCHRDGLFLNQEGEVVNEKITKNVCLTATEISCR